MQKKLIKIGSITYALKARKALSAIGIRTRLQKTSSDANGCAYSIEISEQQLFAVIAELKKQGISYTLSDG